MVLGLSILPYASVQSKEPAPGMQVEQIFKSSDSAEVPFLLYLPESYKPDSALPLMLFLHGRGESDGPLSVVAKWGPPLLVSRGEKLPYILLSPQCPKEDNWSSATQQARLVELLDSIVKKFGAKSESHLFDWFEYGRLRFVADGRQPSRTVCCSCADLWPWCRDRCEQAQVAPNLGLLWRPRWSIQIERRIGPGDHEHWQPIDTLYKSREYRSQFVVCGICNSRLV